MRKLNYEEVYEFVETNLEELSALCKGDVILKDGRYTLQEQKKDIVCFKDSGWEGDRYLNRYTDLYYGGWFISLEGEANGVYIGKGNFERDGESYSILQISENSLEYAYMTDEDVLNYMDKNSTWIYEHLHSQKIPVKLIRDEIKELSRSERETEFYGRIKTLIDKRRK